MWVAGVFLEFLCVQELIKELSAQKAQKYGSSGLG